MFGFNDLFYFVTVAPPPKASKRQNAQQNHAQNNQTHKVNGNDLFGSTPFSLPQAIPQRNNVQTSSPFLQNTAKPNYDISDFNLQTSVFNTSTSFTNGLTFDAFDTQKGGNIFGNGYNGFGNLSEKQPVQLDSNFNGFLDKTVSEMKVGTFN